MSLGSWNNTFYNVFSKSTGEYLGRWCYHRGFFPIPGCKYKAGPNIKHIPDGVIDWKNPLG